MKILLAEDELINQKLGKRLLEKRGFEVDVAGDGAKAMEMMLAERYDLVLMDVSMPVLDGLDATRRYREAESWPERVPILAMTAFSMEQDRQNCLDAGMDGFLGKPLDADAVQAYAEKIAR